MCAPSSPLACSQNALEEQDFYKVNFMNLAIRTTARVYYFLPSIDCGRAATAKDYATVTMLQKREVHEQHHFFFCKIGT